MGSSILVEPSEMDVVPLPSHIPSTPSTKHKHWKWWLMVGLNTFFLLAGQVAGTLLGGFYYQQGGNSKWLQTLTLSAGFPILYLLLLLLPSPPTPFTATATIQPSFTKISLIYIALGLALAVDNLLYSCGLLYLSNISTYSLVCATQLGFNAVFSYFINSERFTHLTLNCVVVLTFSTALLGLHSDTEGPREASGGGKYVLGFILTLTASALYSLILSLMELTFQKVIKSETFTAVLDMQIYTAMASTAVALAGLFASGEWKGLRGEMGEFGKGRVAYVMTVVWETLAWQMACVGVVGLIFEVSSLFSNVISTLAIPLAPVFAVILLHDTMDGIKVVSLLLALWGFASYFYQNYIDYKAEKRGRRMKPSGAADTLIS